MSFWLEYLEAQVDADFIREVARLEDEALRLTMAAFICSVASGAKIPQKAYRTEFAKRLLAKGKTTKEVSRITQITERQIYRLKKDNNGQA